MTFARGAAAFAALLACAAPAATLAAAPPTPAQLPRTRMESVRDTIFGTVVTDPYRWLEDGKSPETRAWIDAQNAWYREATRDAPGRERVRARVAAFLRADEVSTPVERGHRQFFLKRGATQELRVLMMRSGPQGREQVLLDPHRLSRDGSVSLRLMDVSNDGSRVAVGLRKGGEDEVEVAFLDVATRARRPRTLPKARYHGLEFSGDGKDVYYSRFGAEGPRVFRHRIGAASGPDELVFGEGLGRDKIITLALSGDGAWLAIAVNQGSAGDQVEIHAKNLKTGGPVVPIVTGIAARFEPDFGGGSTLFVQTNWNAPRGRILAIDLEHPGSDRWREVLKEGQHPIEAWTTAGGNLLVSYSVNVLSQVYLIASDGRVLGPVPVGESGVVSGLAGSWDQPNAYLTFQSYTVPPRILRVVATTNSVSTFWAASLPFRSEDYETRQLWFASKDGTKVPMFVSHRRGLALDGKNPVYLTGYGGFAVPVGPYFSAESAVWMENGGVWAEVNLRGGSEFGEEWHRAAMLEKKQTTFDDFIAAAEYLIQRRYTSPAKLAIGGGSNGGLLVGAAMTQRPDLFRAVICTYPLLDMVRYHRFLVARFWTPEYGSSENEAQFRALNAYSPYHRVQVGAEYPAVLFMTGDSDTRVDPLHARKMTALVQSATGSERPVLLHYDTAGGHAGGAAVTKSIEEDTAKIHFALWQLGVVPREGPPPPVAAERPRGERQP